MKNFGFSLSGSSLFVILLSTSLLVSASPASSKEHKKKLLDKLRAALTSNDTEILSVQDIAEIHEDKAVTQPEVAISDVEEHAGVEVEVIQDEIGGGGETSVVEHDKVESPESVTNTYMARFRTVFKRVLEMLGLRRRKDGRQSRLLAFDRMDDNDLDRVPVYQDEVRTTVGAVLGQKECIQKAACVSGTYLKGVKGKQLIFALLDVFSPTSWKETVRIAKQSAIFNESCNYKCLDE